MGTPSGIWRALGDKGWRYWLSAACVLAVAFAVEHVTAGEELLTRGRYQMFQAFSALAPRALEPRFLKIVLIGDDEYWRGPLAHRTPTKRDYLARLVNQLDADDAAVIALDFDLPLDPDAAGRPGDFSEMPADYRAETDALIRAVIGAAQHRKIVLSRNIAFAPGGGYRTRADVFQLYGLCAGMDAAGRWRNPGITGFALTPEAQANIACGYIALPYDMRRIPPPLPVAEGKVDSFSLAIARAINPQTAAEAAAKAAYGNYIPETVLEKYGATAPAGAVLQNAGGVADGLRARAVIIGAHWHLGGYGEGAAVDTHPTPAGDMNGALIHADFAEAMLDSRTYGYVPEWVLTACELIFAAGTAILLAIVAKPWAKFAAFAAITLFLLLVQWLMLIAIGVFFEAFLPIFGLLIHSLVERLAGEHPAHKKA